MFKVAIAGLGIVGTGVVKLLGANRELIAHRARRDIIVTAVSARDRDKNRSMRLDGIQWFDDPTEMARTANVDVIVELIGGCNGIAEQTVKAALCAGRHVITANKALIANHGQELAIIARDQNVALCFEAAVAGGIPIVKTLREGLAGNHISRVYGILNGTCNYILTQMRETGRSFTEVLTEAQNRGYAESDPSFDIDGIDATHKLAILASLAFGVEVNLTGVYTDGIRHISPLDLAYAEELGYRVKLLGIARMTKDGLEQRVHPCMVPIAIPIAQVEGVFNAVIVEGDSVGNIMLVGRGAGSGPTASAVVADLIDLAHGRHAPTFGVPADLLQHPITLSITQRVGPYYLRLMVRDQPGVIADVTAILRDQGISLESMLQRGRNPNNKIPVVLTTHDTQEAAMNKALQKIGTLDCVLEPPCLIRIENIA